MNERIMKHASNRWLECPINSKRGKYWERVYRRAERLAVVTLPKANPNIEDVTFRNKERLPP